MISERINNPIINNPTNIAIASRQSDLQSVGFMLHRARITARGPAMANAIC